jgi:diguanylate cyclase (GGDEF)-like protein
MRRLAAICVCLSACSATALAAPGENIRFNRISLEQGLSQSSVNSILQDRHGLMWFATQDGLNRFDGYGFRTFKHDPQEPSSLSSNFVWTIYLDSGSNLWVGTEGGGLNRYNPEDESFLAYRHDPERPSSLSNDRVRAVLQDRSGALWVGTEAGLNRFDHESGSFERFLNDPEDTSSISNDRIRTIYEDREGALWVGTYGGGLNRFDRATGSFVRYQHEPDDPDSLSDDDVRAIYEDSRGEFWVGTYEGGLNRFHRSSGGYDHFRHDPEDPHSIGNDRVRAIFEDEAGRLWVGTDAGLSQWRRERRVFTTHRNDATNPTSLSDDRVMSLFQDAGGVMWVGTQRGLSKWNARLRGFTHHQQDPLADSTFSSNIVTSLFEDRDGTVWVGTYGGGLNRYDPETDGVIHYRHDPDDPASLSDDRVMAIMVDSSGILWVGTFRGGLNRFDRATGRFFHYRNEDGDSSSLAADGVTSILEDSGGRLWVGTYRGGLHLMDRESGLFTRFLHDPEDPASLSDDRIMVLFEDSGGTLWAGTDGGGLNRLDRDDGSFTRFAKIEGDAASLSSDVIWSIHEDGERTLWIGTQGAGLIRWSYPDRQAGRNTFRKYTERDGLPNEFVYGILEDGRRNLWLSTNKGLAKFDRNSGTFRSYDISHGLQSNEFNFGAYHQGDSGKMYFGGNNGFNAFMPERINDNRYAPPIMVTSILKLNEKIAADRPFWEMEDLRLGYKDYVISFEFAALDYTAPEKNRYAYMLEGFDEDWIEIGGLRRATYTNLDPGRYTFRVRGSNNDGLWNSEGVALAISVDPPPWKTWWAYTIYALALFGMVLSYTRAQRRKLQREEEYSHRLENQVKVRTSELAERNEELEEANKHIEEASLTDQLTGLRNRRYLQEYLQKDLALTQRYYRQMESDGDSQETHSPDFLFLMIDLDGFKEINDRCGHDAGDQVLVETRKRMIHACRESDTLIRWGGDEFLIVCRNTDRRAAEMLAERLRRMISENPIELRSGETVRLGCSLGFAHYPFVTSQPSLVSWEKVVAIADRALYIAKQSGRDAWVGISASFKAPGVGLVESILHDPERLASEGAIQISTSLEKAEELVCKRT